MKGLSILIFLCYCTKIFAQAAPAQEEQLPSPRPSTLTTEKYNGFALHTVFNIPLIRYNIHGLQESRGTLGSLEYFNSLGAGFSISFGEITIKSNDEKALTEDNQNFSKEMSNAFGLHLGVLFSKHDSSGGNRTIFAPTIAFQILDFQLGAGYELGTVSNTFHRFFFTLSYGIPLTKLTGTGSYLFSKPKESDVKAVGLF